MKKLRKPPALLAALALAAMAACQEAPAEPDAISGDSVKTS